MLHQLVADGAQAVRGRAHELRGGDGLVQLLRHRAVLAERRAAAPSSCPRAPWPGCRPRPAAETRLKARLQEAADVVALRLLRHQHERAQLDAVRVRLDLDRLLGQLGGGAREGQRLVAGPVGVRALAGAHRPRVVDASRAGWRAPCARRSG